MSMDATSPQPDFTGPEAAAMGGRCQPKGSTTPAAGVAAEVDSVQPI